MKRIFGIFLTVIICFSIFSIAAVADNDKYNYVIDEAGLLKDNEIKNLSDSIEELTNKYDIDIVLLTVDSLNGKTSTAFADDFYDYNGYNKDGILFLISMEERDWAISTKGYGIEVFTDYGQEFIFDSMKDDLADNEFYSAFTTFVKQCGKFIKQADSGEPYDVYNKVKTSAFYLKTIIISIIIGLIIAIIVTLILKGQLKSVRSQHNANSYVRNGSVKLTGGQDIFLYKNISKIKKETASSNGGGSSIHTSSSGSAHGGSSGKF